MMRESAVKFSVFTKPWPEKNLTELASFVKELGFDGIELPVRPGYQVSPENMHDTLPRAVKIFQEKDLAIFSVAGTTDNAMDERFIQICGQSGVDLIRVMARVDPTKGYLATERELQGLYQSMIPHLETHKVRLGIQNHHGYFVGSAIGLVHLIDPVKTDYIGHVLDPAHCALAGEPEDLAIEIAWQRLFMINLKNAFRRRLNGPEANDVEWGVYWTDGKNGVASWDKIVNDLIRRKYTGVICLHAEYSSTDDVEELTARDLRHAKKLFDMQSG